MEAKNREHKGKAKSHAFSIGDRVAVFRPRHIQGVPSKALVQWRGPYVIIDISRRGYKCRHEDGSEVTVSRAHIQPYTASPAAAADATDLESALPGIRSQYNPGDLLIIGDHPLEEEGNYRFQMARFQGFSDGDPEWLAVRYLGTTSAKPPYKFLNVWIDNKDGKAILRKTRPPPGG